MADRSEYAQFIKARYGDSIDFGPCVVGKNLNLLVFRGFARLDSLAVISAPDVYDMLENPTGTQRALNREHARSCLDYALESVDSAPEEQPFAFPEVILNARDKNVVELYDIEDPTEQLDLDSYADQLEVSHSVVGLRVLVSQIRFPKPEKAPQISRVDGNHRLYGADIQMEKVLADGQNGELEPEYPIVPFAILIGLTTNAEVALFRDINAEHKGMETAHLDSLTTRLHTPEEMKQDPALLPLWIANELTAPGRSFSGMVFKGGSTRGVRAAQLAPPIKINALKTMVAQQLRSASFVTAALRDRQEELLTLIDRFWLAVKRSFPDAWTNKKDYILLQAIGLNGFAEFGGKMLERAFEEEKVDEDDFVHYLAPVVNRVSLKKADYTGIAGARGARVIAETLLSASSPDAVKSERVLRRLQKTKTVDEKLGIAED